MNHSQCFSDHAVLSLTGWLCACRRAGGPGDGQRGVLPGVCAGLRGEAEVLPRPQDDVPIR